MDTPALEKFDKAYYGKTQMQGKYSFPKALEEFSSDELDELENEVQETIDEIENEDSENSKGSLTFYNNLLKAILVRRKDMQ